MFGIARASSDLALRRRVRACDPRAPGGPPRDTGVHTYMPGEGFSADAQ